MRDRTAFLVGAVLAAIVCPLVVALADASAAPRVERAEWRVSTYGWPGDDPYQRLAGCGYKKVGGLDAGRPMPCRLTPTLPIVAHRTLPLGILVRVCYTRRVSDLVLVRRCAGARVGDRCGPGCDRNRVDADLSWGLARRIAFPYTVGTVTVLREVEP